MKGHKEKFYIKDKVVMVSPKSGLVKYGVLMDVYKTNTIIVLWLQDRTDEMILEDNQDNVFVMGRNIQIGDVVRKVCDDKQSQFGYCENVHVYATVKILNTNKIIENINAQNLTPIKPFDYLTTVVYESRFGNVCDVKYEITFASRDGSIFTWVSPDGPQIKNAFTFVFNLRVFYPGRKFKMRLASIENAKFINMTDTMRDQLEENKMKRSSKRVEVYVKNITVASVEVKWSDSNKGVSKTVIYGDDLKKLKTVDFLSSDSIDFSYIHWYTIKKNDNLISMKQWRSKCIEDFITGIAPLTCEIKKDGHHHNKLLSTKEHKNNEKLLSSNSPTYKLKSIRLKRNRMGKSLVNKKHKQFWLPKVSTKSNSKVGVKICFTKSMIDVIWQDGTKESGIPSTDLYTLNDLNEYIHVYLKEFFPGDFVKGINATHNMYGVVESIDHKQCTARIQWFEIHPENPILPIPAENTELSIYELIHHDLMLALYPGDLIKCSDTNPGLIGRIISRGTDGRILVMGVNGEKIKYWPQELQAINTFYKCRSTASQNEIHSNENQHLMPAAGPLSSNLDQKIHPTILQNNLIQEGINIFNQSDEQISDFMVRQKMIEFNRMKNFKPNENKGQGGGNDYYITVLDTIPFTFPVGPSFNPTEYNVDYVDTDTIPEYEDKRKLEEAGVFEMVETLGDGSHKYIDHIFYVNPKILKVVTKNIEILQKSLPAGIWVKTFEDRMDLFSMMIRGPEKTPYAGGLFIFDVKLPNTYPFEPPLCHYYSFCDNKLNPNLYQNGKVCISLLDPWVSDDDVEQWSPKYSNLLQLLVSIQGLVLVSEPYFNEPGFELMKNQGNAKHNSRAYNEMTIIQVVLSMTNMLKMNANTNFKNEIIKHVTTHGPKLINTIENWMKISERELTEDEKLDPGYPLLPLTKGFCLSIDKALKGYKDVLTSMNITFE